MLRGCCRTVTVIHPCRTLNIGCRFRSWPGGVGYWGTPSTRHDLGRPHLLDQSALAPWIDQTVGTLPTPADCVTCGPSRNQIATLPLLSCQRMSLLPSPLKSPVPTIVQPLGALPTAAACETWAP